MSWPSSVASTCRSTASTGTSASELPTSQQLADASARYVLHTIDRFGPQRCMFESNFPVDKVSCSYIALWNSFKRLTAAFSADDKAALFHDTAARVYRLNGL